MKKEFKKYNELSVNEKIQIKQYAIDKNGKRWHIIKPDYLNKLNELQIYTILN